MAFPATLFTATGVWRSANAALRDLATNVAGLCATLGKNPQGDHDTVVARLDATDALVQANLSAPVVNLRVVNHLDSPGVFSTTKLDVSADVLCIQGVTVQNFTGTVDLGVSGLNGLDTGGPANGWQQLYAVYNQATLTAGLVFTKSDTPAAPTLPSGFTLYRRIDSINRVSGALLKHRRTNDHVLYQLDESNGLYRALTTGTQITTFATVSLAAQVPQTAVEVDLMVILSATFTGAGIYAIAVRPTGGGSTTGVFPAQGYFPAATPAACRGPIRLRLETTQSVDYLLTATPTTNGGFIDVHGYVDPV